MKYFLILTWVLMSFSVSAQRTTASGMTRSEVKEMLNTKPTIEGHRKVYPKANYFYESLEDYEKNKALDGIELKFNGPANGKIVVLKDGKEEKIKISEMPTDWVSNEEGLLMRRVDNELYTIVVNGPICYYIQYRFGSASPKKDGSYFFDSNYEGKYFERQSETLSGPIEEFDEKEFKKLLKANDLYDEYEADIIKREMKDSVNGFQNKVRNKNVKFLKLLNEKLK